MNEGLEYVFEQMKSSIRLKSNIDGINDRIKDDIYTLTLEFCKSNSSPYLSFSEESINAAIKSVQTVRLKSNNDRFSLTQTKYHAKFRELLADPQNCKSVSDVYRKLKSIEKEIYQSNIEETDKIALLAAYAIGRNSLEFWIAARNDKITNAPRLKVGTENTGDTFLNWWKKFVVPAVKEIVYSDYVGGAAGFVEGAIAGGTGGTVIMPGAGSVTGAIVGGFSGAASGAIYGSAVGGFIYFFF